MPGPHAMMDTAVEPTMDAGMLEERLGRLMTPSMDQIPAAMPTMDQEAPEAAPSAGAAPAVVDAGGTLEQLQSRLAGLLPGSEETY